ncbi:MAG: manganese efflux pump [Bacilli bacterium]|nr:manganese efflux pump [Bacilli bacterium]
MSIYIILVIAVSLSMDAFSLSLAYGTLNLEKKYITKLSTIVGIYHFFMPLIGLTIGTLILKIIPINPNTITLAVLSFIGIEMIIDTFTCEEKIKKMSLKELILFGLAVSIDSFSVGIGLNAITKNYIISVFIFSITSFTFTYLGLILGKKINNLIGKISTLIGGIILIIIGIMYII